jgi:hypothetical protein
LTLPLVGQLLGQLPVALYLTTHVLKHTGKELLGQLGVELLGRDAAIGHRLVGLFDSVGELLGRFVYPLLLLLVHVGPRS